MEDVNCPYCGESQSIDHDDCHGYTEDELHQQQCGECSKYFVFTTSISYYYTPHKADCLNDGSHTFKLTNTYPKEASKMRCSQCEEERRLTDLERKEYGIGTMTEYFESLKKLKDEKIP